MIPGVVKLSGSAGLLLWLVILAGVVIIIVEGPTEGSSPVDVEYDRIAIPCGVALSLAGLAVSAGILRAKAWAYYGFIIALGLMVVLAALVALGTESWLATFWAGAIGSSAVLLWRLLDRDLVRRYFRLTPRRRKLLVAPGWLNIVMGLATFTLLYWPRPTPMFGVWMQEWTLAAASFSFGASHLSLGWGLLTRRRWVWSMTIVLALASLIYSAGLGWDTNPQGRLGAQDLLTRATVLKGTLLGLMWTLWTLWRIWLYQREERRASEVRL